VVDAKSGEDITHNVLTQIIMEEEARGTTMLPVNFLRQLIGMYGDSMQAMVPQYLEASLDQFQRNQSQFRDAISGALTGGRSPRSPSATSSCSLQPPVSRPSRPPPSRTPRSWAKWKSSSVNWPNSRPKWTSSRAESSSVHAASVRFKRSRETLFDFA
jgi:hypothetical protein